MSNGLRVALSFTAGLLLARGLNPDQYGDYAFLLGSFVALRSFLDLGASNAFFTFISGINRNRTFFVVYFAWVAAQFLVTSAAVLLLMPQTIINRVWLGHPRSIIFLAFLAAFMQQQIWSAVAQIGESSRKTLRVQAVNVALAIANLLFIAVLTYIRELSIVVVFWGTVVQYAIATLVAFWLLKPHRDVREDLESASPQEVKLALHQFSHYCKPLVILSISTFLYDFADKWMLQRFGGSGQQGIYQVSYQVAAISLLATTSILNIFWKEVADAKSQSNVDRVAFLYKRVSRGLVMVGAVVSAFVIPWTHEVIGLILGSSYALAAPVLAIMFLYPIHQSMGQIGGTMFLASGHTRAYTWITTITMLLSLPISYFIQASKTAYIPGLGLGAIGMALKMVVIGVVSVNVQAYVIARYYQWSYDWLYQLVGVFATIALSFTAKTLATYLCPMFVAGKFWFVPSMVLAGFFYAAFIATLLFLQPWLVGMEREEVNRTARRARAALAN